MVYSLRFTVKGLIFAYALIQSEYRYVETTVTTKVTTEAFASADSANQAS